MQWGDFLHSPPNIFFSQWRPAGNVARSRRGNGKLLALATYHFGGNFALLFNWSIISAVTSIAIIVMLYCASCCIEFKSHSLKRWPEYIMSRAAFSNIFHHLPSSLPSSRIADGKYWYFIFLMTWMYYEGQGDKGGWGLEIVANHKKLGAAHHQ